MHSVNMVEGLESRRLLSSVVGGILNVNGTMENDIIAIGTVGTDLQVTINGGTPETFAAAGVTGILCFAAQGNDQVTIQVDLPSTVHGGLGDDTITTAGGADEIYGGQGNDVIAAGNGTDVVYGKDGDDLIWGMGKNDTISGGDGLDTIHGGAGDDSLSGDGKADLINGNDGADSLYGGAGNDTLSGQGKSDLFHGSFGDDSIIGGAGNDRMFGDDGNDFFDALDDANFFADNAEGGLGVDSGNFNENDTFLEEPVAVIA